MMATLDLVMSTNTKQDDKPYCKNISRGTTRFEYSSKEYVRVFEYL